jgi:hypothetical protein
VSDFVLIDGDIVMFLPLFPQPSPAIVTVLPGKLEGSGPATIGGKKICVEGDEGKVKVSGCAYLTPQCPIPGVGELTIEALADDQKAGHTKTGGKPVLLKGTKFKAKFTPKTKAKMPPPTSAEDPVVGDYQGEGMFITTNLKVTAT